MIEIGIDTGGTFTDIVARERGEPARLLKIPSTPADPSEAIIAGIRRIIDECGIAPRRIARVVHGTTVGTNAVLEENGARIGLLATAGFGDVLEIGRQVRDPMYAAKLRPATPVFLAPGARRKEIVERVDAQGRRAGAARRGLGARRRRGAGGGPGGGDRDLFSVRLPQSRARAARALR